MTGVMRWVGRVLFGILALIPLLIVIGFFWHNWALERDAREYPPYGGIVYTEGREVHMYCIGEGSPTVVLEGGLGSIWLDWARVQPTVGTFTRTCAYDRPGYGWSQPSTNERTATQIARELHRTLEAAGESAPYVLVGHATGALHIEAFNMLFGDEVAGLVFVDPTPTDTPSQSFARLTGEDSEFIQAFIEEQNIDPDTRAPINTGFFDVLGYASTFGVGRLIVNTTLNDTPHAYLPTADQQAYRAAVSRTASLRAYTAEFKRVYDNIDYVRENRQPFGDKPVYVLARGLSASYDSETTTANLPDEQQRLVSISLKAHHASLEELANLSENGTFVVAEDSGHYIQLIAPDLVTDAIQEVVNIARADT